MCGFIVSRQNSSAPNNYYIKLRGQDFTKKYETNGFTFIHNLLSVTGDFTPQPFVDHNIVCLYNGEIYNHKFAKSDGENLIPLYKKYGVDFPKYLDGEWAIALYDFNKKLAVFATDLFATKPIWRRGLECASYKSGLSQPPTQPNNLLRSVVEPRKMPANKIEVVYFNGTESTKNVYDWDLNQHKNNYDDWIVSFEKAVKKRVSNNCFIGLSSGYDSGAIASCLSKLDLKFKAFIIEGKENKDILSQRMELVKDFEYIDSTEDYDTEIDWVKNRIEPFKYIGGEGSIQKDKASLALSKICRLAHSEGRKVYLSGQGSDEIISDYSLLPRQSTFKGKFPDKLPKDLWPNFYGFCQYNYLGKEEYVAGSHSIETRYPFLDKDVVQEFLWLTPELKNKYYKAPIREYLVRNNFPFEEDVKIGLKV